jgi:hypothetical protein
MCRPLIVWTPQYKWNIVESGIKHHTSAIISALFCWLLDSCPSNYNVCLPLSLISSNIPLLFSVLPVAVFHYIVLILYAIFLSFNIEFQLSSAQLAYVVCQCFAFILPQFDVMKIADDIHIHFQRLHFSVHTMAKQSRSFVGIYRHTYLVLKKNWLKCREKINLILTTCSLKLKSSNVCVLIDSIFTMGGKLLFSTDSDIYFFSFVFGNLLSPPYHHHSRRSYWYQLISSSLCSFIYIKHTSWSVSHPLYRNHIVLLSRMIRYNVVPHCSAH